MEVYTAITYNTRFLGPSLTVSIKGGIDIEEVPEEQQVTLPVDIYQGLDAYQAGDILARLGCPQKLISALSRSMISFWDLFISTGMQSAEINPWRVTPGGNPFACDFKAVIDEANYKSKIPGAGQRGDERLELGQPPGAGARVRPGRERLTGRRLRGGPAQPAAPGPHASRVLKSAPRGGRPGSGRRARGGR